MRQAASAMRQVAHQEALRASPPPVRYKVVRKKPLTLEALGSDDRLTDGEEGFEVPRGIRQRAKVDDTLLVGWDLHGDAFVLTHVSAYLDKGGKDGKGGGVDEADEEEEAEAPKKAKEAKEAADAAQDTAESASETAEEAAAAVAGATSGVEALLTALATSGVGMIIGPGPRPGDWPFGHVIYVSPASEEPVDANEADIWIKPE